MSFIASSTPKGIKSYASAANFPVSSYDGDAAIAADTNTLYIYDTTGPGWVAVATPGAAIAIDGLTGDVTATGPGVVPATVALVGGSSAANVHAAELLANAATDANTASTIVKRDASGNFSAGTITASVTGHSSLDLPLAGGTMSGAIGLINGTLGAPSLKSNVTAGTGVSFSGSGASSQINFGINGPSQADLSVISGGIQINRSGTDYVQLTADDTGVGPALVVSPSAGSGVIRINTSGSSSNRLKMVNAGNTWTMLNRGTSDGNQAGMLQFLDTTGPSLTLTQNEDVVTGPSILYPNSFTVQPGADIIGLTGSTTANASTTIVGSGTKFTTDLGIGDRISLSSASSTYASIIAIASDTSLTVDSALGNGSSQTIIRKRAIASFRDSSQVQQVLIRDTGAMSFPTLTASRALTLDASKNVAVSATTATELGYVNGVTSAIQTQLNAKQASGNYITALTGDVTASGPGSVAATIANLAVTNAKIANSTIDLTAKVTGVLPVANGGTNSSTALNSNRMIISSGGKIVETGAMTAGSVLFADSNGLPAQDNSNFFWDGTNHRLGIRTSGAGIYPLQVLAGTEIATINMAGNASTNSATYSMGFWISQTQTGTNCTNIYGVNSAPNIAPASGTTTSFSGIVSTPSSLGTTTNTVSNVFGMQIGLNNSNPNSTWTTCFDLYIAAKVATGPIGTAYGIYQNNSDLNYFGGAITTNSTMTFSGLKSGTNTIESTGAGTALLGTNSPAVTNTSPYRWLKITLSDASVCYIPCWK